MWSSALCSCTCTAFLSCLSNVSVLAFSLCQLYTSREHAHRLVSVLPSQLSAPVIDFTRACMYTLVSLSLAFSNLCVSYRLHAGIHTLVTVGLLYLSVTDVSGTHTLVTVGLLSLCQCQLQISRGYAHYSYSRPSLLSVTDFTRAYIHTLVTVGLLCVSVTDFTRAYTL